MGSFPETYNASFMGGLSQFLDNGLWCEVKEREQNKKGERGRDPTPSPFAPSPNLNAGNRLMWFKQQESRVRVGNLNTSTF